MLLWVCVCVCVRIRDGRDMERERRGGGKWVTGRAHESINRDAMRIVCVSATSDHGFLPQGHGIEFLGGAESAYAGDFLLGGFGLLLLLR